MFLRRGCERVLDGGLPARRDYASRAELSCAIRRDLRRAAFRRWIAPFWAALSSATIASWTDCSAAPASSNSIRRRAFLTYVRAFERSGALWRRFLSPTLLDLALGNSKNSLYLAGRLARGPRVGDRGGPIVVRTQDVHYALYPLKFKAKAVELVDSGYVHRQRDYTNVACLFRHA